MGKKHNASAREIELAKIQAISMADGFIQSSILFALIKLKIFELIGEGSKSANELSEELNARSDTLSRLLNAGVVLKLLASSDGINYAVSPEFCNVLLPSAGNNNLNSFIQNLAVLAPALYKLDEAILYSKPTFNQSEIMGEDKEKTRQFTLAMHDAASFHGEQLAYYVDTSKCLTLLDIGCGPGTYAFHLGFRNPDLEIFLMDHPEILEIAKEIQERLEIKNKVHYLSQDFLKDDVFGSYDMILVSNTLHMIGEKASRELIKRLYESINQGGSLVIQANFLRNDRMGERWPVFLDMIQRCVTPEGRNHTEEETRRWLEDAGFTNIEFNSMTVFNSNSYLRGYKL